MAELGSGSGTGYPNAIDTDTSVEANEGEASPTTVRAECINDANAAIVSIETELGVTPKGSFSSVKSRLDALLAQRIITFPAECFHTRSGTAGWAGFTEVQGTNLDYSTLDFDTDADEIAFTPPFMLNNWDAGNVTVKIAWIGNAVTGNVAWVVSLMGRADGEAFDSTFTNHPISADTIEDVAYDVNITSSTFAASELAASDTVVLKLIRDVSEDNLAVDARLLYLQLIYTEN